MVNYGIVNQCDLMQLNMNDEGKRYIVDRKRRQWYAQPGPIFCPLQNSISIVIVCGKLVAWCPFPVAVISPQTTSPYGNTPTLR